jgi:predicted Co/Zn/Cd cation transporter (cation efflux family)
MTSRFAGRAPAVVLLVIALGLLVATVIYLTTQCQDLPALLPGRETGSTHHRVGYAAVAFALAALAAWVARRAARAAR